MAYNIHRINQIRERLVEGDTEGAMKMVRDYAGQEMNRVPEVSNATKALLKGEGDVEELRKMYAEHENRIVREILEEIKKSV